MEHYGDITAIHGYNVPIVDIITGGSPCQDLSVAGKRAGLAGERSGLFMEQIRIIKEMRKASARMGTDNIRPRYMVWENVCGAFSSNGGEDFRAVLEETAKIADERVSIPRPEGGKWTKAGCIMGNGYSIAWRTHDAQYWGVPQRRRRISLVADFGGLTAPEILFKSDSVSRDTTESGTQGQGTAQTAETSADKAISFVERAGCEGGGKGILIANERTGALSTLNNQSVCCLQDQGGQIMSVHSDKAGALRAQEHGHQPCVLSFDTFHQITGEEAQTLTARDYKDPQCVCYGISAYESNAMKSSNPHSGIYEADTARTLDNNGGSPACNQGGMIVLEGNGSRESHKGNGYRESETMYTLNTIEQHAVCAPEPILLESNQNHATIQTDGISTSLPASAGAGGGYVPMVCDARGNGDGNIAPTMTGDHQNRITDYTAIVVDQGAGKSACNVTKDVSPTLAGTHDGAPAVSYEIDRAAYNQGANAQYDFSVDVEQIGTQTAKGPGAVASFYPQMKAESVCYREDVANTIVNGTNSAYQNGVITGVCIGNGQADQTKLSDKVGALNCMHDQQAVITAVDVRNGKENEINGTLQAKDNGGWNCNSNSVCRQQSVVRRLTPLECTRLQGYPDGWVDIGEWTDSKGKKHKEADAPKYKALGNSIALPFWQWLADRICAQYDRPPTMASLFDGIGGFPLVFSRVGAVPVWASEIEEFPIAVTKIHFPEEEQ